MKADTVLAASHRLVELAESHSWTIRGIVAEVEYLALVDMIRHLGTQADEALLRSHFLADPSRRLFLLPLLAELGSMETARSIAAVCCPDDRLADDLPGSILQLLGRLRLQSARDMLWTYALEPHHETGKPACLGLLDLDCSELERQIEAAIRNCAQPNSGLFPEYLPALAAKTGNPDLIPFLLDLGRRTAADNRAGILIGLAAFGPKGLAAFETVLENPVWEAADYPSGNWTALHLAVNLLGIGADGLWSRFLAGKAHGEGPRLLRYRLDCLLAVLDAELVLDIMDVPHACATDSQDLGPLFARLGGEAGPGLLDDDVLAVLADDKDNSSAERMLSDLMNRLEARYRQHCLWAALRREWSTKCRSAGHADC